MSNAVAGAMRPARSGGQAPAVRAGGVGGFPVMMIPLLSSRRLYYHFRDYLGKWKKFAVAPGLLASVVIIKR